MIIYIAGKFRGPTPWDVEQNVRAAESMALRVAELGHVPLCPHTMYAHFDGQLTAEFWLDATMQLLERCDAVLMLDDWESSEGAVGEHDLATELDMPVFYGVAEIPKQPKDRK